MTAIGSDNFVHSLFQAAAAVSCYVVKNYWLVIFSYLIFVGCLTVRFDLSDYKLLVIEQFWCCNSKISSIMFLTRLLLRSQ